MTKEQELQKCVEELERLRVRSTAESLYDYLIANDFVFEQPHKAFKPINEQFEMGVTIWPGADSMAIDVQIYDREKTKIEKGRFQRYGIYPQKIFDRNEEADAIEFIKNPPTPIRYKVTFSKEVEQYFIGSREEVRAYVNDWDDASRSTNISVDEIYG